MQLTVEVEFHPNGVLNLVWRVLGKHCVAIVSRHKFKLGSNRCFTWTMIRI